MTAEVVYEHDPIVNYEDLKLHYTQESETLILMGVVIKIRKYRIQKIETNDASSHDLGV